MRFSPAPNLPSRLSEGLSFVVLTSAMTTFGIAIVLGLTWLSGGRML